MTIATQAERIVWTVALPIDMPHEMGRRIGESGDAAHAAYWYASIADMCEYLAGWLATHTAEDDMRRAAQGLFEQLTVGDKLDAAMDGLNFYEWRSGVWSKKETEYVK